ncbi:elongation factor 1-alpha, partial [Candidatus Bathyarchaeota archaeon]|nr:elongation factor 1-alpha [Candidatus Bathyarchaeota archaeon]
GLKEKKNPRTGEVIEKDPKFLKTGDAGLVIMEPVRPIVIETFKDIPQLGRFAIRDSGRTVAVGVVIKINERVR